MAILSEHLRQTKTVTDANGDHIRVSRWTHADTVELPNGLTLAESVVYLKQADWDALGDEKYTNNVEYRITDATSEVHGSVVGVKGDAESAYRDGEVNITAENIGLGNVPNVETNDQIVTYEVAESNTTLTSGEKLSVAFGKIAKAISSFIAHLADKVSHITSDERAKWDGYETSISKLNRDLEQKEIRDKLSLSSEYFNITDKYFYIQGNIGYICLFASASKKLEAGKHYDITYQLEGYMCKGGIAHGYTESSEVSGEHSFTTSIFIDPLRIAINPIINIEQGYGMTINGIIFV